MKALITGASSGIGRDLAIILSRMGYELILVARRTDKLLELQKELKTNSELISLDLSVEGYCYDLYEKVQSQNIDILVNNAGFGLYGEFLGIDLSKELNMIDLNIKSVHILTKLFLKDFKERDSGYILNVASSAAFLPGPLFAGYYATKAYVLRLTEGIYEELRRKGSKVYIGALCPGPVRTEFDIVASIGPGNRGLTSKFVAEYAVKMMFKRKMIIVPGITMKLARFFTKFLPDKILLKASYAAQSKKQQ
jgi:short-subunit dehydrogenase